MTTVSHVYKFSPIEVTEFRAYAQNRIFLTTTAADLLDKAANPVHKYILPLEANLRLPTDSNAGFQSIIRSIKENPDHEIWNPIQVTCESIKIQSYRNTKKVEVSFKDGQGVLDGSHRLYALWKCQQLGLDLSKVKVSFLISEGQIDITQKCQELNTYSAPTKLSFLNKAGMFDSIKTMYSNNFPSIVYYDGEKRYLGNMQIANPMKISSIDNIIARSTGLTTAQFSRNGISGMTCNKGRSLLSGVKEDLNYWRVLFDIHSAMYYLLSLLEQEADKGTLKHVTTACRSTNLFKGIVLPDNTPFYVKLKTDQLIPLFLSALSVNFDWETFQAKGTYEWLVPLQKIEKFLIRAALKTYKYKSELRTYQGSATYLVGRPELAEAILEEAQKVLRPHLSKKQAVQREIA